MRGGKRAGAGRKALGPKPLERLTIRVTEDEAYWLDVLGKGNMSAGARSLIDYAIERLRFDPVYDKEGR